MTTKFRENGINYHVLTAPSGLRDQDRLEILPDPSCKPKGCNQVLADETERAWYAHQQRQRRLRAYKRQRVTREQEGL